MNRLIGLLLLSAVGSCAASGDTEVPHTASRIAIDTTFARIIESLSEPGGHFDTDNLISNETSYLHVVGTLETLNVHGGAYIGVGPDQNFSYIAHVQPVIAFIIDIRRDNLLQHFLFKSLFAMSDNRAEYLAQLFGRPVPPGEPSWSGRDLDDLIEYIDRTPPAVDVLDDLHARVRTTTDGFGLPLSEQDHDTIRRIHRSFIENGLGLRFNSFGRPPRPYYPTYRQLLLETDLDGRRGNYLAREEDFQVVKRLQDANLIVPVVGDLAGPHALRAIGRFVAEHGERVSMIYTSNVEFYLMRNGSFDRFADNVAQLPHDGASVIARSYFGGMYRYRHPQAVSGYFSTQLLQPLASLVQEHRTAGYRSYIDLVTKHSIDLRGKKRAVR